MVYKCSSSSFFSTNIPMLKYGLNISPPYDVTYWKTFMYLCKQTISRMYTIFNTAHDNHTCVFQDHFEEYLWKLQLTQIHKGDIQTDSTFQLCWKVYIFKFPFKVFFSFS